jgi:flagellar protein FliO/FliZ
MRESTKRKVKMTSSVMPLLAFLVVIALIPGALWLMKRSGVGGAQAGSVLRPVANLSVGTTQKVQVVEVAVGAERHWLVLGVTGDNVSQLASYVAPDLPAPPQAPAHAMAVNQLIARWRGVTNARGGSHE